MSLLFKDRHIPLIREGTKTATRRDWDDNYHGVTEGQVYAAVTEMFTSLEKADCFIRVVDHYEEPLGEMTHEDALKEGGYSVEDFREAWRQINGDYDSEQVVDVVEFEYVGREHPEEATA